MPDNVNLDSRLELLLRLVESITASPDLDEVLRRVVRSATSLVNDSLATFWILEGSRLVAWVRDGVRNASTVKGRTEFTLGEGWSVTRHWSDRPCSCPTSWPTSVRSTALISPRPAWRPAWR